MQQTLLHYNSVQINATVNVTFKPLSLNCAFATLTRQYFHEIKLPTYRPQSLTIKFREDSFITSFGHAKDFWGEDGHGDRRYIAWLESKLKQNPPMVYHAWLASEIVGQVELGLFQSEATTGYVNLYYLAQAYRGQGLASELDAFCCNFFQALGLKKMLLSVSPSNQHAIAFYKKHGWLDQGPRFSEQELAERKTSQVHLMLKHI